jgi:hypothetical protein
MRESCGTMCVRPLMDFCLCLGRVAREGLTVAGVLGELCMNHLPKDYYCLRSKGFLVASNHGLATAEEQRESSSCLPWLDMDGFYVVSGGVDGFSERSITLSLGSKRCGPCQLWAECQPGV